MTDLTYRHIATVLDDYDVFLFDIWGVIIEGNYNYPEVVGNINHVIKRNKKVFFVTNAPRGSSYLLSLIKSWGIQATQEMIISSGEIAIDMILNSENMFGIKNPLIYHLGLDTNDLIDDSPIATTLNIQQADLLLLTLYHDATDHLGLDQYDDILQITSKRNIITLCANPDLSLMQQGICRYCAGYFAEKVKQFGGTVIYTGKPHTEIYQKVLGRLPNISKKRMLMIGDTFYTDILGANKLGIDSALVLTGNATQWHSSYHTLEEKLVQINIAATEANVMPNFVIQLGAKQGFS